MTYTYIVTVEVRVSWSDADKGLALKIEPI